MGEILCTIINLLFHFLFFMLRWLKFAFSMTFFLHFTHGCLMSIQKTGCVYPRRKSLIAVGVYSSVKYLNVYIIRRYKLRVIKNFVKF